MGTTSSPASCNPSMMSRRPAPGCAVPVVPEEASRQKGLTVCRWEACRSASRYAASASASPQYGSQAEPLRPPAPGSVAAAVAGGPEPGEHRHGRQERKSGAHPGP
ncbi:hypothetical protein OHT20_05550 [Streptomyces caniferus]|uniref:Uncharacterized protein n=1 Tax=Streptomyces caniferus TaxID=285557 RepID=A0ABZ1VF01_9ACTN|nr:hypothetical protein [Streptomyces caniferus]